MDLNELNLTTAVDIFLLLLIGIGPKIALVPFLGVTSGLDQDAKSGVTRKMLTTAFAAALALIFFGGFLTRLLHFSTGALAISSGLILLALSIPMVIVSSDLSADHSRPTGDPSSLAGSPLAIPYLLNPVGIVVLVTVSAEAPSAAAILLVLSMLLLVLLVDMAVFRWANRVSQQLDAARMLVVEKVFGFLLAALAVQLALHGLTALGLIHQAGHS
jgi:multiple antibiotic resistance protein